MGHFRNYGIGDAVSRYLHDEGRGRPPSVRLGRLRPACRNAAIKNKLQPLDWTLKNVETGKKTLQRMGISYDWDREVRTFDPGYYKWTQWLFLLLFKNGWAYRAASTVNWCEQDGILANEQVKDGKCWRCHSEVIKKPIENCWFFKYPRWRPGCWTTSTSSPAGPSRPRPVSATGSARASGCEIDFDLDGKKLTVFTTRPDTTWA
jgi:leucyl-tRNA synthetase